MLKKIKYQPPRHRRVIEPVYDQEPELPTTNWRKIWGKIFKQKGGKNGR